MSRLNPRLSPEAEQLVRSGRSLLRPNDVDRERVFQGLLVRGIAGPDTPELSQAPAAAKVAALWKVTGLIVGLGVASAGWYFTRPTEPPAIASVASPPVVAAPIPAPTQPQPAPAPPSASLEVSDLPRAAPEAPAARAPSRQAPASADHLAREVVLLSRASAELHAARPAAALEALDEHERKFPKGVLRQERAAARVKALCALGRLEEARAELARLTRAAPGSPHAARAAEACASTPREKK